MSLRDELRGAREPAPPFVLLLPRGWVTREASRETFDEIIRNASKVFRSQHRPDLDAQFRTMVEASAAQFLRQDPVQLITQQDVSEDELLPLTITVSRVTGPHGQSLDGYVSQLVREKGATQTGPEGALLRWAVDSTRRIQEQPVSTRATNYLIPIPKTERRQALLFCALVPTGAGEELEESSIAGLQALSDAIMSTFRWSGRA